MSISSNKHTYISFLQIVLMVFWLAMAGCNSSNTYNGTTDNNDTSESSIETPASDFVFSAADLSEPFAVTFTDASTGSITTWSWAFGDGQTSSNQNPAHIYSTAGNYTVSLTVTGPDGTDTSSQTVQLATDTASVTYPIVDTGQLAFYGNTNELYAPVQSSNDLFYGQDATFSGRQPAYQDNGDGTVTDLNTGLMWIADRGDKVTFDQALAGASSCTVGGYTDWRLPTIKELYSLIDFNGKSALNSQDCIPYIDTTYFEIIFGDATGGRVIDGQDWSATQYVSTTMKNDATVFGVNFIDGRIKGYPRYQPWSNNTVGHTLYVRYVRGNAEYGVNQFNDNGNGTVTDDATGLMWAQNDSGVGMNWQDALAWVQTQNAANYAGYNDWRLPNAKELQSIVDYTRSPDTTDSAAIDPVFKCTQITNEGGIKDYPFYWTGTTHLDSMGAIYVSFGRALGYMNFNGSAYYTLTDVHGAGAQRSDPKAGDPSEYYLGTDINGNPAYGRGPQGDVIRIDNFVRLVRDAQ